MQEWNWQIVLTLMGRCAAMALKGKGFGGVKAEFKSDNSPVTELDHAIEQVLAEHFDRPEENSWIIGEETEQSRDAAYLDAALKGTAWVVDPIDGTSPFANGLFTWGISIGFMKGGMLMEGAIILPDLGEAYISNGKEVLLGTGINFMEPIEMDKLEPLHWHEPYDGMVSLSQMIAKRGQYRGPERVQTLCCCVYALGNLFTGKYLAYVAAGKLWDLAAGLAILEKLGGSASLLDGTPVIGEPVSKGFQVEAWEESRWSVRQHLVLAMKPETVAKVAAHVWLP